MKLKYVLIFIVVVLLFLLQGCFGISNLQSASLLPTKSTELTGAYTFNTYHSRKTDENDVVSHTFGLSALYGVHDNINVRARYNLIAPTYEYTDNIHYLSFGAKVPIIKKYAAFYLPASLLLSYELNSMENLFFEPTLIGSIYLTNTVALNTALSYQVFIEDIDNVVSFSLGADFSGIVSTLVLQPEFTVATHPPTTGLYFAFTLGCSLRKVYEGGNK